MCVVRGKQTIYGHRTVDDRTCRPLLQTAGCAGDHPLHTVPFNWRVRRGAVADARLGLA